MGVTAKLAAALAVAAAAAVVTAALPTTPGSPGTTPPVDGGRTCACDGGGPATIDGSYAAATLVVRATPINSYVHDGSLYYTLTGVTHLKGCPAISAMPTAVTARGPGGCGVPALPLDVPALLFLRDGMVLSRCDAHTPWAALRASQVKALTAQRVCGRGCRPGEAPTPCLADPCGGAAAPPCASAVKCVADTCGGCWARWFTAAGEPAACNTAPSLALDEPEEAESVGHAKTVGA
ncbi:hypothetical protein I4F81_012518 [Pyropia yezoensis]|uniref:Uncharacterized protein n=1 Tax=Pyropia yezoensis TaxID=2788 RepID=A0ACC3CIX7_PYRYE|nr:hypothetical protein I4F81_012518 [Neopyropia yezoensis]